MCHQGRCGRVSSELRTISSFILSRAPEISSVTCSSLKFLTISLSLGRGPRSLRAIASLSTTALPITFKFAPHKRQNCKVDADSVPHCGQYISCYRRFLPVPLTGESLRDV